jgi:hypothetical protein
MSPARFRGLVLVTRLIGTEPSLQRMITFSAAIEQLLLEKAATPKAGCGVRMTALDPRNRLLRTGLKSERALEIAQSMVGGRYAA